MATLGIDNLEKANEARPTRCKRDGMVLSIIGHGELRDLPAYYGIQVRLILYHRRATLVETK